MQGPSLLSIFFSPQHCLKRINVNKHSSSSFVVPTLSCFSVYLSASTKTCCDHSCQETCVSLYKVHLGSQQSAATTQGSQL